MVGVLCSNHGHASTNVLARSSCTQDELQSGIKLNVAWPVRFIVTKLCRGAYRTPWPSSHSEHELDVAGEWQGVFKTRAAAALLSMQQDHDVSAATQSTQKHG